MREEVQESKKVQWFPWSLGSKVPGSQGPKYLKLRFKYEIDSKEGPSCFRTFFCRKFHIIFNHYGDVVDEKNAEVVVVVGVVEILL